MVGKEWAGRSRMRERHSLIGVQRRFYQEGCRLEGCMRGVYEER